MVGLFKAYYVNNLLLTGFELFLRQVKHVKSLFLYPFSHRATQSTINFLVFIPLKLLAKIMTNIYNFAVTIVMFINITINKTHSIYDSVKKMFMQLALMILL